MTSPEINQLPSTLTSVARRRRSSWWDSMRWSSHSADQPRREQEDLESDSLDELPVGRADARTAVLDDDVE
ncbi:MAG: hypothetical protein SV966_02000 [Actinomycetota bacterium]|nr:hypothetical protein [Actinomycetota bacterium]